MKAITMLVILILTPCILFAGEPYVKTVYKNKNWIVQQVGITGDFKMCTIRSAPHYLDKNKNIKYGTTYFDVSYPTNNVTFNGENIGAYFKIAKRTTLQIDNGTSLDIKPGMPLVNKGIVENILKNKGGVAKISIDFGDGTSSIHSFNLVGFSDAYQKLKSCSK